MDDESEHRAPDQAQASELMGALQGLDLASADGRAGLTAVLQQLEHEAPGALKRLLADVQMQRAARALPGTLAQVH